MVPTASEGRLPGPGAQAYALAAYRLSWERVLGAGVNAGQLRVLAPRQSFQPQLAPLAGIGGVIAGQIVSQPLIDPSQRGVLPSQLTAVVNPRGNSMKQTLEAILLAGLPSLAHAQATQVPAIVQANAAAAASVSAGTGAGGRATQVSAASLPATMPPPIRLLSSSAPLNSKEKQAVALARRWANQSAMPHAGEEGQITHLIINPTDAGSPPA